MMANQVPMYEWAKWKKFLYDYSTFVSHIFEKEKPIFYNPVECFRISFLFVSFRSSFFTFTTFQWKRNLICKKQKQIKSKKKHDNA